MIMAFNGNGAGGGQDGPHNKRLCTGQEMIETVPLNSRNNNNNINVTDEPRRKREVATRPNHILLFTIINPVYPITVDVLHTICSPNGQVQRIVIFKKNGVQAMVEFDSIESATRAREALNGCDIYSGCCTLKIDYAKPEKLNVYKNDTDSSWDYTLAAVTKDACNGRAPLLHDPNIFGGRPTPYNDRQSLGKFTFLKPLSALIVVNLNSTKRDNIDSKLTPPGWGNQIKSSGETERSTKLHSYNWRKTLSRWRQFKRNKKIRLFSILDATAVGN
nr:uncharacterized protein LOC115253932 isoform X2 [Aedes albopictus]